MAKSKRSNDSSSKNLRVDGGTPFGRRWRAAGILTVALTGVVGVTLLTRHAEEKSIPQPLPPGRRISQIPEAAESIAISPLGDSIFYAAKREIRIKDGVTEDYYHVIRLNRASGSTADLTPNATWNNTQVAISPLGDQLAFHSDRTKGLVLSDPDGSSVETLTDFGTAPAFSNDGKYIAYVDERVEDPLHRQTVSALYRVSLTSRRWEMVYAGDAVQPQFSPHDQRIVFSSTRGGQRHILSIALDGKLPVPITSDPAADWSPRWSVESKSVLFVSDRGGARQICQIGVDEGTGRPTSEVSVLTPGINDVLGFALSAGFIVYLQHASVVRLNKMRLTSGPVPALEAKSTTPVAMSLESELTRGFRTPDVSKDGKEVAVYTDPSEGIAILDGNNGKQLRVLTHNHARNRGPRFSPDGHRIAYYSNAPGKYEAFSIGADGKGLVQLTSVPDSDVWYPIWSPDSTKLAFFAVRDGSRVLDFSDQTVQRLPLLTDDGSVRFAAWDWSHDGNRIAGYGLNSAGEGVGIYVFDRRTNHYTQIAPAGQMPIWFADGRRLVYQIEDRLMMADSQSRISNEIARAQRNDHINGFTLSHDDRFLWISLESRISLIFLIGLK